MVLRARASRAFLSLLTHSLVFLSFSLYHFFALLVVAFVSFIVNSRVDTVCVLLACLSLVVVVRVVLRACGRLSFSFELRPYRLFFVDCH